jgi:hypothetical protein
MIYLLYDGIHYDAIGRGLGEEFIDDFFITQFEINGSILNL